MPQQSRADGRPPYRLISLGLAGIVAACTVILLVALGSLLSSARTRSLTLLNLNTLVAVRYAEAADPDWTPGRLLGGMQGLIQGEVAVYRGDAAIASTGFGGRGLIGTRLPPAIRAVVLDGRRSADLARWIDHRRFLLRFAPILDARGQATGAVVAGVPELAAMRPALPDAELLVSATIGVVLLIGWGYRSLARRLAASIGVAGRAGGAVHSGARTDRITGLPSRHHLEDVLQAALDRCEAGDRGAPWPTLITIDVPRLRAMQDSFGEGLIDRLLNEMKLRFQHCLRADDVLARVRVDEFAMMPALCRTRADATRIAERVLQAVNGRYEIGGQTLSVIANAGIALSPEHGASAAQLIKTASIATQVKAGQAGVWQVFEPQMEGALAGRLALEGDLNDALRYGQFELFYQPLITMATDRIGCFEALLRWHHPMRGMVSPLEFIPMAEQTGLIVPLGAWVLDQACREAAGWPCGLSVAVNLSALQVRDPGIVATVAGALARSGLPASRLELEVTETVLLEGDAAAVTVLHDLRALGVRISMDDFGTGHSSLSYLRDFPFDKIKIDQSFVREMLVREDCLAIIRAVTGLAGSLNISVTAEGAETAEQIARLRLEGCTEVQGYYYSRPRPAGDIDAMLERDFRVVA